MRNSAIVVTKKALTLCFIKLLRYSHNFMLRVFIWSSCAFLGFYCTSCIEQKKSYSAGSTPSFSFISVPLASYSEAQLKGIELPGVNECSELFPSISDLQQFESLDSKYHSWALNIASSNIESNEISVINMSLARIFTFADANIHPKVDYSLFGLHILCRSPYAYEMIYTIGSSRNETMSDASFCMWLIHLATDSLQFIDGDYSMSRRYIIVDEMKKRARLVDYNKLQKDTGLFAKWTEEVALEEIHKFELLQND